MIWLVIITFILGLILFLLGIKEKHEGLSVLGVFVMLLIGVFFLDVYL